MGVIYLGQEELVFARVLGREAMAAVAANTDMAGTMELSNEPRQLRGRDLCHLPHVSPDQSFLH